LTDAGGGGSGEAESTRDGGASASREIGLRERETREIGRQWRIWRW
jgi:hypothetical protein